MGQDFAKVQAIPGRRPAWSRIVGRRAVLPLAALVAATTLAGCIVDRGYQRDYPGYGPPGYRTGPDRGPPRDHDNRNDVKRWPEPEHR